LSPFRKREHLLNQIQAQAQKIESLMQQLAEVTAASSSSSKQKPLNVDATMIDPEKPLVLSPTTEPYFGTDSGAGADENNDATTDKAVSDWIAKARQSLDHFGALVSIGGGAMPQQYLINGNYEETDSSDDDEYVDVSEELDLLGSSHDRYELAVEEPNSDDMRSEGPNEHRSLRHKSSASSFGTAGTGNSQLRRKGDRSKPASLPVEAAPFGLFGNLSLKSRSRTNSRERDEEDKGPGIHNENFFKPSEFSLFLNPQSLKKLFSVHALNSLGRLESAQHQAPHILTRGVITPQEAEKLFEM
jgi:hypothetical protein